MKPLYIFDLDGTLANIEHRLHFIDKKRQGGPDWDAFFLACVDDRHKSKVITTLRDLHLGGADIDVWSGRSDVAKEEAIKWLDDFGVYFALRDFRMRQQGDHTPDHKLKEQWLEDMSPEERFRLVAVFEDRQRVVDMWRANGVTCFQVAPGDF